MQPYGPRTRRTGSAPLTFVQTEFLVFFTLMFGLYWGVRQRVAQNVLLLVGSAIFYGWVHPFWLVLLYVAALLDYGAGLAMEKWPDRRKLTLIVSISANLGLLGYYKYFDFFVENTAAALTALGVQNSLAPLGIVLPAGISFYTFQSMAYSFDVYRGELKPRKNLLEYLLAVSFFCHLVAGPVQRASNLLQQAEQDRRFDLQLIRSGFALAMWGAFKKVCIADGISAYADKLFAVESPSTSMVVAGILAFALQILTDFSGYTDIARGTARMLGWELMLNFRNPYLATNPSDFWNRWHISFSTWIRDYVYIPLGGSRGGFWFSTRNTFGAMVFSGIWHGASWNFVLWGLYHAALLTGYRLVVPRIPAALKSMSGARFAAIGIMFGFTCFGWFLFRELQVTRIFALLTQDPFAGTPEQHLAAAIVVAMTLVLSLPLFAALAVEKWLLPRMESSPWYLPAQTATWAVFALALFTFARMSTNDFIYFQF
jgi:D-alanyl-lipoteichoic acid acyltransferase DltB (MBOAT superfamily)